MAPTLVMELPLHIAALKPRLLESASEMVGGLSPIIPS